MLEVKDRIHLRVQEAIQRHVFPGCVVGVLSRGEKVIFPYGHFTYDTNAHRVREDSVYDLASITKSIPVAALALQCIADERLSLTDKIKNYIPELQNDFDATIEDVLRYRVQGPRLSQLNLRTFEEIRTSIFEAGFNGPPGSGEYSNVPAYLLGVILERIGGRSLPALSHDAFFGPLNMKNTTFFPARSDCVPTELDATGSEICGIVHDESARVFARARCAVGHAGLFSTAPDLLECAEALLRNRLPAVVEGAESGLGWAIQCPWFMGTKVSPNAFGKTGFTGTSIVVDRSLDRALVILSNRTYPKRPPDQTAINSFRADIANMVFK